ARRCLTSCCALVMSACYLLFSLMFRLPRRSTLFPYTTLFRSVILSAPDGKELSKLKNPAGFPLAVIAETSGPYQVEVRVPEKNSDRKSTRLNSSHQIISYAVFCLKKKNLEKLHVTTLHTQFDH